jgi:hypothetical protein
VGEPNTPVVYTLTVTNGSTDTDTCDVALAGGVWAATAPSAVGPLGADESADFTVAVDIPLSALSGDFDVVTVTVTSQGDGAKSAEALLTTTAMISEVQVFLPLVLRNF